jgi:hypothetical protein
MAEAAQKRQSKNKAVFMASLQVQELALGAGANFRTSVDGMGASPIPTPTV